MISMSIPETPSAALAPHACSLLRCFLQRGAIRFGDFTLKSGRKSPYFINTGCLHQGGDLATFGAAYAEGIIALSPSDPVDVVFGPAYKGIPLALAAAQALESRLGQPVGWAYDRKEAKDHGDGGSFVGAPLAPGTRVVVVDDVLTAGTALRETLAKLQPLGVTIVGAVVAVDRQEAGAHSASARQEIAADFGLPIQALMTIRQVVDQLAAGAITDIPPLNPELLHRIRSHLRN
ncbi:MAG: orotate phosphoribosyltransferase [Planctomycetota bacterium]|nr:MAG: orotate phosphoribosyltransferase [Planctomycetota bacterium]